MTPEFEEVVSKALGVIRFARWEGGKTRVFATREVARLALSDIPEEERDLQENDDYFRSLLLDRHVAEELAGEKKFYWRLTSYGCRTNRPLLTTVLLPLIDKMRLRRNINSLFEAVSKLDVTTLRAEIERTWPQFVGVEMPANEPPIGLELRAHRLWYSVRALFPSEASRFASVPTTIGLDVIPVRPDVTFPEEASMQVAFVGRYLVDALAQSRSDSTWRAPWLAVLKTALQSQDTECLRAAIWTISCKKTPLSKTSVIFDQDASFLPGEFKQLAFTAVANWTCGRPHVVSLDLGVTPSLADALNLRGDQELVITA